jgi:hypothetical protein
MTIIVSVKINDGIIMAADSALTFPNGQVYQHANKIVNLRKGLPIGVMSTGDGGIGNESLETLFKDLRRRFSGDDPDPAFQNWKLDPTNYTMRDVATRVRDFLFVEKAQNGTVPMHSVIHLCGYSSGRPLAETWYFELAGTTCQAPIQIQDEGGFGPLWNGQTDALNRLIFGLGSGFVNAGVELGFSQQDVVDIQAKLQSKLYALLFLSAMPIQDAIDLARFLVETTSGFVKFSIGKAKNVGGTTEIAAITKHEGFKWVQRKHFFSAELNP